jgi:hypothetical protein
MNNRKTYIITDAALEVMDGIHAPFRAKFVSDAIIAYAKKKGVLEKYTVSKNVKVEVLPEKNKPIKKEKASEINNTNENKSKGRNKFKGGSDSRFD